MTHIIDPPPAFATVSEWREYLRQLEAIAEPDARTREAIAEAKAEIDARDNDSNS